MRQKLPPTTPLRWVVIAFCAAAVLLALRWGLCFREPHFKYGDESVYLEAAKNLVTLRSYRLDHEGGEGDKTSRGQSEWLGSAIRLPPGLPFSLALMGQIVPLSPLTAKLLNATVGWMAVLFYALAAYWLSQSRPIALAVMLTIGLHPPLLYLNTTNYPNTFEAFWLSAFVLLLVYVRRYRSEHRVSPRWGLAEGCVLGIGALYVPTLLFLVPALALAQFTPPFRRWLVYGFALGCGFVIPLLPWIARNAIAERAFIPFGVGAGKEMYAGFNDQARANLWQPTEQGGTYTFERPPGLPARILSAADYRKADAVYQLTAIAWIKTHPMAAGRLWLAKALNFFRWDVGAMHTVEEGSRPLRIVLSRATTIFVFSIFLFGCLLASTNDRFWALFSGLAMIFLACGHAFLISRYRLRLPFEPLLLFVGLTYFGRRLTGAVGPKTSCQEEATDRATTDRRR
jgi:hypothetical protein